MADDYAVLGLERDPDHQPQHDPDPVTELTGGGSLVVGRQTVLPAQETGQQQWFPSSPQTDGGIETLEPLADALATGYRLGYNCTASKDPAAGEASANYWTLK